MRNRLAVVRFFGGIRRTHLIAALIAGVVVTILRVGWEWRAGEGLVVLALFLVWILGLTAYAMIGLPDVKSTFLLLDQRGKWKDCFSSAWEFLQIQTPSAAQELHLQRADAKLPDALLGLPLVFPRPSLQWTWVGPVLALLFAMTPWLRSTPDARDLALTDGMKDAAALQAEELQREAARIQDLSSLTEEEKKELEALGVNVTAMAETLANPEGLTTGEMLESLESRAREAEKLAEKLGLLSEGWASAAMIEAMSQQPDTADLSLLIRDKAAAQAAEEAMRLRGLLEDVAITGETQERMTRALETIMLAATDDDRTKPIGERFGNASRKLSDAQPRTAAREFEELAKFFRDAAGREAAVKKLEQLAETLREAGSEISGSELQKMESIAEAGGSGTPSPEGLQPLDAELPGMSPQTLRVPGPLTESGEGAEANPLATTPTGKAGEGQKVPVPGAAPGEGEKGGEGGGGEKGEQAFSAPVPGEPSPEGKPGSGLGMGDKSQKGEGEGGMLSAPVPGMESAQAAPGAGMSLGSGASSQSGKGGDQAGSGSAPMTEEARAAALTATADSRVAALAGAEGESTMKAIKGDARAEKAARSRQEVIADFIAVEEQALDDQSLPLSRRQHVLRYFSAVREQFEKAGEE